MLSYCSLLTSVIVLSLFPRYTSIGHPTSSAGGVVTSRTSKITIQITKFVFNSVILAGSDGKFVSDRWAEPDLLRFGGLGPGAFTPLCQSIDPPVARPAWTVESSINGAS